MRIRKLELQGFKTFVDRQTFHFGKGIAGVVGPNGCGKSNFSDAVRWCIGEMSAKNMRGSSMSDVIFNGTSTRSAVGMAEVSLTFIAAGEPFPGQWARFEEILITRKLYRDGGSEYLINQERVRRKDIVELFMDTGMGNPFYSFIAQGRVEELISARPEERRDLIEEAAGISKYKARRKEALGKLETTTQNLDRTTDLTDEMGRRLKTLERQVAKAAKYRRFRVQVRQGEMYLLLAKYSGLSGDRRSIFSTLRDAKKLVELTTREVKRQDIGLQELSEELMVIEAVVGGHRDELAELEATRRERESARHYQSRELETISQRVEAIKVEISANEKSEAELTLDVEQASNSAEAVRILVKGGQSEAAAAVEADTLASNQLQAHRQKELVANNEFSAAQRKLTSHRSNTSVLENTLEHLSQNLAALKEEEGSAAAEKSVAADEVTTTSLLVEKTEFTKSEARLALDIVKDEVSKAKSRLGEAKNRRREFSSRVAAEEGQLSRLGIRMAALEELQRSHEGFDDSAKALLAHPDSLGTLAEHLNIQEDYEVRAQQLFGSLLEVVLVESDVALGRLIAAGHSGGEVSVLSLEGAIASPKPNELIGGFGGTEVGLRAMSKLFTGWVAEDDIDAAMAIWRDGAARGVVTVGGVKLNMSGLTVIGSASTGAATAVIRRRREIDELDSRYKKKSNEVIEAKKILAAGEEAAVAAQAKLDAANTAEHTQKQLFEVSNRMAVEAGLRLRQATNEAKRFDGRFGTIASKIRLLSAKIEERKGAAIGLVAEVATAEKALIACEAKKETLMRESDRIRTEAELARATLLEQRASQATAMERLSLFEAAVEKSSRQLHALTERIAKNEKEIADSELRSIQLVAEDSTLNIEIQKLGESQGEIREKLAQEAVHLGKCRELLKVKNEKIRVARDEEKSASDSATVLEVRLNELKAQIEAVREQAESLHGISLAGQLDTLERKGSLRFPVGDAVQFDLPVDESSLPLVSDLVVTFESLEDEKMILSNVETVRHAKRQIERLGEVNLAALEEYTELRGRYTYLEEQRNDLEESVDSIKKAIAQLNQTCRERFRLAFDQVEKNFSELYPRLVGGGSARLELTDDSDLLETGIDILVEPPGKRLQNLSLLSGGEKAMTAIALIFSLFLVKPSPFCLLDEVDAPLDDSNGARFNNMLREISEISQFVVITHNKKTMEAVDTLYGITMPIPGESRLVTVQID